MSLGLEESELRMLFEHFDADCSGGIDLDEFVFGVRDPLSERRLNLVYQAFAKLDSDGSGVVTAEDISRLYDASKHPEVIAGRLTPQEVLRDFLDNFDVGGIVDGMVTREEFTNYYTNIGASIDNEDYFELMIRNAWHISGGVGAAANSANRRVLVTRADGSQYVEEIKSDLGLKSDDKAGMVNRLRAQGVEASNIELYGGMNSALQDAKNINKYSSVSGAGTSNLPSASLIQTNEQVAQLKIKALNMFSEHNYSQASATFQNIKNLLLPFFVPTHPDIIKLEQSIVLCEKRSNAKEMSRNKK